ncbi:MAG TPA: glycosyltransferase family 2 protein [Gammaproteobacteria bacterium]|nr:glycosyltransferase family 2 protein [Gammaproteobacteria bacterium]
MKPDTAPDMGKSAQGTGTAPLVSVVMPVHNAGRYLPAAIDSILGQSLADIELIAIDDGSSDGSWATVRAFAARDPRIRTARHPENRGIVDTLNTGLELARGNFIARMDADDIALPERLRRQVSYMSANNIDFSGCWTRTIGNGRSRIMRFPVTDTQFKTTLLFQTPFAHPTLMMRRSLLDTGVRYRSRARHAEEYDLAVALATRARMGNLPEPLLLYRIHPGQVSATSRKRQLEAAADVRRAALKVLGVAATEEEAWIHGRTRYPTAVQSIEELAAFRRWLEHLATSYRSDEAACRIVAEQWLRIAIRSTGLGPAALNEFRRSWLAQQYRPSRKQWIDLTLAALVRLRYGGGLYRLLERFSVSPGF